MNGATGVCRHTLNIFLPVILCPNLNTLFLGNFDPTKKSFLFFVLEERRACTQILMGMLAHWSTHLSETCSASFLADRSTRKLLNCIIYKNNFCIIVSKNTVFDFENGSTGRQPVQLHRQFRIPGYRSPVYRNTTVKNEASVKCLSLGHVTICQNPGRTG